MANTDPPACRVCGCTDDHACNPPCAWFDPTLCTTCALAAEALREWSRAAVNPSLGNLARHSGLDPRVRDVFLNALQALGTRTPIELVGHIGQMLHERASYLNEYAAQIGVRVQIDGRWQDKYLTELAPADALREGLRLLLRAETPARRRTDEEMATLSGVLNGNDRTN